MTNEHNNAAQTDWRELCRRLYVELWHCDKQMTSGARPKWKQGPAVRDVLRDANLALEATPAAAPAPAATQDEPFGYFRPDAFGWTDCAETDEGAIALYERPAAPAVPQGPVCAALGDIVSMWDQHVPSEYVTPLHMQAKRALAGQQPVSPDMRGWCAYVGGMVAHWVVSEPDAFDRLGPDRFEAAIAGIIERRLWAMPKSAATPAAPSQEPVTLTDEEIDKAILEPLNALLDHIYEHTTLSEGILPIARKIANAIIAALREKEKQNG